MDHENNPERRKASLRGKGRDILLGQQFGTGSGTGDDGSNASGTNAIDPASLPLSDEEADVLLGFSPDDPVFDLDLPLPEQVANDVGIDPDTGAEFIEPDVVTHSIEDEFLAAATGSAALSSTQSLVGNYGDAESANQRSAISSDALPLGEKAPGEASEIIDRSYRPASELDALVPVEPEYWADLDDDDEGGSLTPSRSLLTGMQDDSAEEELLPDPFDSSANRTDSSALFEATAPPDQDMMAMLFDDERIRTLAGRIESLQEELATDFNGPRSAVDAFQKELLMASGMLLEGREYYDDAHAVVYRVWADMNRVRRTEANILRYRPMLLNYYVGWGVVLGVLFLLKALFTSVTEAVGMETASAMYYPMLLGIAGALISGLLTLERHTTRLRDFDPIHISWYLFNPLLGGVMGLLMFMIASIANEDLLHESASDAEHAITYLLCVVAGMNQNNVLRQLNDLLRRFTRSSDTDDEE